MPRPHKPSVIKQMQGTERKCRVNGDEPKLPPDLPAPPDGISAEVRAKYYEIGSRLLAARVSTALDSDSILGCATAYCNWAEAERVLAENGSQFIERDSGLRAHPAVAIRNEADRRHRGWLQSLGMTPADRSKVNAQKAEAKSELAKLLEETDDRGIRPN